MTPGYCTACRRPATDTEVGWFHNGQGCGGGEFVAACACGGFAGGCWVCQPCAHEWIERGSPGDYWRECWLCGVTKDVNASPEPSEAPRSDEQPLGGVTGPLDDDQALRDGLRGWGA